MKKTISIPDRLAGMVIAVALIVVGVGFLVLGVSFLPVIGIFVGIPVLGLAWRFLTPRAIVNTRFAGFLVPADVTFHPGHAWARVEGMDTVTVGMDDFAARLLGSADSISLPKIGFPREAGIFGLGVQDGVPGDSYALSGGRRNSGRQRSRGQLP